MIETNLISHITFDFQTKSDVKVVEMEWKIIMNDKFGKFKKTVTFDKWFSNLE